VLRPPHETTTLKIAFETGFQHKKRRALSPAHRHPIFIGTGGGPGPAIVGFVRIAPLNSEIPRVLIERCAISAC
jgi:hypothetical protein